MKAQRPKRSNHRSRFDMPNAYVSAHQKPERPSISGRAMLRIALFIITLACGFLGWRYLTGEQFIVRQVFVEGSTAVAAPQIQQASGLLGRNVIWLNLQPNALQQSVEALKRIPGVELASVNCTIGPPAECRTQIQQSQPLAVFKGSNSAMWADRSGRVLRTFGEEAQPVMALHVEDNASMPAFGTELSSKTVRAIEEIATLGLELTDIVYEKDTGITLVNTRGQRVRVGVADEQGSIADKLRMAGNIQAQLAARGRFVRIIDVRYRNTPYFID